MDTTTQIRVAIADDQSIFRNGVVSSLKPYPHISIVCEAENGNSLLNQLELTKPDVVLLDMKMPDMDGVAVCKAIQQNFPNVKVIGLSVYDHHYYISSLFEAGGSGYLLKDVDPMEIASAIQSVYKDGSYMNEKAYIPLIKKLIDIGHPSIYFNMAQSSPLKQYELDILKYIALEYTAQEIADKMNLSRKTIENYRGLMMTKIGAKNTAGLVTYAIKKGIVVV